MTVTYAGVIDTVGLLIQISDGASPPVFAHPCLINSSRSYEKTAQTSAEVVPRCDDPTQAGKTVRTTTSTDSTIAGSGMLDRASAKKYNDMVGTTVAIKANAGSATGDLVATGPYILEKFTLTGSGKGKMVTCDLAFSQADDVVSTAHA